jgi:hypothetical protein
MRGSVILGSSLAQADDECASGTAFHDKTTTWKVNDMKRRAKGDT